MTGLETIKSNLGQDISLEKGLRLYMTSKTIVDDLSEELLDLANEHASTKVDIVIALQAEGADVAHLNQKYNDCFSNYIDQVQRIKKLVDEHEEICEFALQATTGLQEKIESIDRTEKLNISNNYVYRKYLDDGLGFWRKDLPQISYDEITTVLAALDSDEVVFNRVSLPINILKPTQQDFDHEKIQSILVNGMWNKDFVPIISKDLHIMDGHHRWASELEKSEELIMDAYMINMPAEGLINKLLMIKGHVNDNIDFLKKEFTGQMNYTSSLREAREIMPNKVIMPEPTITDDSIKKETIKEIVQEIFSEVTKMQEVQRNREEIKEVIEDVEIVEEVVIEKEVVEEPIKVEKYRSSIRFFPLSEVRGQIVNVNVFDVDDGSERVVKYNAYKLQSLLRKKLKMIEQLKDCINNA